MMMRKPCLAIVVLSISILAAHGVEATIIVDSINTQADLQYTQKLENGNLFAHQTVSDHQFDAGSFSTKTYPIFTPPSGATFDTFGRPAVLAATQPAFGFNSVAAKGFFANDIANTIRAHTLYTEVATGQLGDRAGVNFDLFGGRVGITCYGSRPALVADIPKACHPSAGTAVEVSATINLTRFPTGGGSFQAADFDAGLRMEVVADSSVARGVRLDISQLGSTPLVYQLGFSTDDGFPPYVTLDFDAVQGFLDAGFVDGAMQGLTLLYELHATVVVVGAETGGFAKIADPFALQTDPVGYFQSQFPGAPLPGFISVDNGPPPGGSAPEPGTLALCLAGIAGYVASRRRASSSR